MSSSVFQSFLQEYEAKQEQLLGDLLEAKRKCDLDSARQRRQRRRQIRRRGAPAPGGQVDDDREEEQVLLQASVDIDAHEHRGTQQEEAGNEEHADSEQTASEGSDQTASEGGDQTASEGGDNNSVTEVEMQQLIMRALGLYEEYYEQRSRVAHVNVFQLFSPAWSTSLECAFCWIAGFRPTAMFSLLSTAVNDLSPDQSLRIHRLLAQTRVEERVLSEELAKVQESVAAPPIVDPVKRAGRRQIAGRGVGQANEALETLQVAMETLLANADSLRTTTAANVVEILNTPQNIKFLTAATQLQRNLKIWGLELDASAFQRVRG